MGRTPCEAIGFIAYAHHQQKRYREKRRRWAWSVKRPYSEDYAMPPPGELETADEIVG